MFNHKEVNNDIDFRDTPDNGVRWTSSVKSKHRNSYNYGAEASSRTDLIPLYKTDAYGNVQVLYSITYYTSVSCSDNSGHFAGGLHVVLYDSSGNVITEENLGRCAVGKSSTDVPRSYTLFDYNIETQDVYLYFYLRVGGESSSDGEAEWSRGIADKVTLTYYTNP